MIMSVSPKCSIIIPVYNDNQPLTGLLRQLQPLLARGHEIIVADGGEKQPLPDSLKAELTDYLFCERGRAAQMNHAAAYSTGDILWFLHADTRLDAPQCLAAIISAMRGRPGWGRFDVRLSGQRSIFRVIESMMNRRSCLTGIATGDQGIFISRQYFDQVAGFPLLPLMEDVAISKRLKKLAKPFCIQQVIETSSRRWEENGIVRTILLMWLLRFAYFIGVPAKKLAGFYR